MFKRLQLAAQHLKVLITNLVFYRDSKCPLSQSAIDSEFYLGSTKVSECIELRDDLYNDSPVTSMARF
jgi:hypothetical protein